MNWYCILITNLEYICKILNYHYPRACWNHYIRTHLWSKFNWLVGRIGSIFSEIFEICDKSTIPIHVLFKEPEDSKTFASNLNSQEYLNQLLLHTWLWLFGRLKPQASAWSNVISVSSCCSVESTSELPLELRLSWLISLTGVGDLTSDILGWKGKAFRYISIQKYASKNPVLEGIKYFF